MTVFYLDTSAWIKRHLPNQAAFWVRNLFDRKETFACSYLGYVEALATIARQEVTRSFSPEKREALLEDLSADWTQILRVEVGPEVMQRAAYIAWEYKLRGADAVHLACAHWLHSSLTVRSASLVLVTSDTEILSPLRSQIRQ